MNRLLVAACLAFAVPALAQEEIADAKPVAFGAEPGGYCAQ